MTEWLCRRSGPKSGKKIGALARHDTNLFPVRMPVVKRSDTAKSSTAKRMEATPAASAKRKAAPSAPALRKSAAQKKADKDARDARMSLCF